MSAPGISHPEFHVRFWRVSRKGLSCLGWQLYSFPGSFVVKWTQCFHPSISGPLLGVPGAGGGGGGSPGSPGGPGGPPGSGPPSGGPSILPGGPPDGTVGAPGDTVPGPRLAALGDRTLGGVGSRMAPDSSKEMLHHYPGATAQDGAPPVVAEADAGNNAAAPWRWATGDCQDGGPAPHPPPCSQSLSCC
eukprot:6348727-Ditylum_brightwellii.AAC.1